MYLQDGSHPALLMISIFAFNLSSAALQVKYQSQGARSVCVQSTRDEWCNAALQGLEPKLRKRAAYKYIIPRSQFFLLTSRKLVAVEA